jgi:hypothetical protein
MTINAGSSLVLTNAIQQVPEGPLPRLYDTPEQASTAHPRRLVARRMAVRSRCQIEGRVDSDATSRRAGQATSPITSGISCQAPGGVGPSAIHLLDARRPIG